jgi:hypothetical protein
VAARVVVNGRVTPPFGETAPSPVRRSSAPDVLATSAGFVGSACGRPSGDIPARARGPRFHLPRGRELTTRPVPGHASRGHMPASRIVGTSRSGSSRRQRRQARARRRAANHRAARTSRGCLRQRRAPAPPAARRRPLRSVRLSGLGTPNACRRSRSSSCANAKRLRARAWLLLGRGGAGRNLEGDHHAAGH